MELKISVKKTCLEANGTTSEYVAEATQQIEDIAAFPDENAIRKCIDRMDSALAHKQGCSVHQLSQSKPNKGKPDAPATAKQLATLDGLMLQKGVTKEAIMGEYEIENFDKLTVAQCRPIIGDLMGGKVPQKPEMPF